MSQAQGYETNQIPRPRATAISDPLHPDYDENAYLAELDALWRYASQPSPQALSGGYNPMPNMAPQNGAQHIMPLPSLPAQQGSSQPPPPPQHLSSSPEGRQDNLANSERRSFVEDSDSPLSSPPSLPSSPQSDILGLISREHNDRPDDTMEAQGPNDGPTSASEVQDTHRELENAAATPSTLAGSSGINNLHGDKEPLPLSGPMHASGTLPILQAPPQASEGIIRNWTRFHHNNAVTLPTTIQPSQLHNYDFAPLSPSPLYSTVLHSQFHFQGPPSALEPVASSNANAENATRKRGRPRKSALLPSGLLEATSANDQSSPAPESQPAAKKQKTLKIQEPENERPAPRGEPLVWADDRTALCESLPYFRAYQGACYSNECRSKSFLFDKYSHSRDIITDKVVLARAGGGMSRKSLADEMEQSKDQENSSHVRSTINSMELYVPVVIIFGNENSKIKSKMPHIYNVGDFFKITHVWYEKSDGLIVIRFRFEKLDHKCPGWWHPQDQESSQLGAYGPIHNQTCTCCGHSSPQVYKQYWICLNHACEQFWKPGDNNSPHIAEDSLEYDERFLHAFTPWPSSIAPYPLRPALMPLEEYHNIRSDESENAIKGIVCPKCGRCTGRGEFYGLVCGNPNCDFTYKAPKEVIPPIALHDRLKPRTSGFAIHFSDWWDSHIRLQVTLANNYRTHRYDIPGIGSVFHMMANKVVNEEKGGPDDMFVELQEKVESLGLERRYLKEGKLNHRTNHFSMNFGMPYKYVAKNPSKSFEEAPDAVRETRSRMEWACRQCLGNGWDGTNHHGFNELLCVGYHGKNKMDVSFEVPGEPGRTDSYEFLLQYHDDGEKGLGPVVAALSIGYPADMRFRLKSKHFTGRMRQGNLLLEPPILDWACQNAEFRKAALSELAQVEGSEARSQKIGGIEAQLKARTKGRLGKDILTMSLNHGDIMIMSGAAIQEYIEHTVVPLGRKRFALTCRYIDPSSVDKDHQPPYAVEEDKIKYDGRALAQPSSE